MATRTRRTLMTLVAPLALLATACGQATDGQVGAGASDTTASTAAGPPRTEATGEADEADADGAGSDDDPAAFCAAAEALDQSDGTTADDVALAAFDDLRRSAPAEISDDVDLMVDTLIIDNYPSGTDASMQAASYQCPES